MIKSELQYSFSVKVLRDGKEVKHLPRQNNLILSNRMASLGGMGIYLHVGTGTATPLFSDTGLDNYLATSPSNAWSDLNDVLNGNVYVKESVNTYTFTVGSVVGNITELGVSNSSNPAVSFHTRALFKDGAGDPTTISVTAADQLVVTYYVKKHISMDPVTAQVLSNGNVIDYTIRPCISTLGNSGSTADYPASIYQEFSNSNLYLRASENNILSIDPVTYIPTTIDVTGSYSPEGTHTVTLTGTGNEVEHTITFPITSANFQLGSCVALVSTNLNYSLFQIEFNGPNYITKNDTETLTIKVKEIVSQVV